MILADFFDFLNTGLRCRPFILIQVEFDISFAWKTINQSIFDIFSFSLVYIYIYPRESLSYRFFASTSSLDRANKYIYFCLRTIFTK